ncbi:hypothetical protein QN395_21405 [Undibacterium sp. RTI2.2]|nr:hypothetical protein [Undibacterium sp. RTI2.2]
MFCTKDGADKEYHAEIKAVEGGYIVQTRHGKRGSATVPKVIPPTVTYDEAVAQFNDIVKEKKSPKKGYTEDESGVLYSTSEMAGLMSGNFPHLLTPMSYEDLLATMDNDNFGWMEKIDGERLMIDKKKNTLVSSNKLGMINSIPQSIIDAVNALGVDDLMIDCENRLGKIFVFDILRMNQISLVSLPAIERYQYLSTLKPQDNLLIVPMLFNKSEKEEFLQSAKADNNTQIIEGIVGKKLDGQYVPGRASPTNATQFKFKFVEDSSVFVIDVHKTKRSVEIGMINEHGHVRSVGNVGVPTK